MSGLTVACQSVCLRPIWGRTKAWKPAPLPNTIGGNVADKSEITIKQVFERLDQWRHLPDYQLERRADIFFALFLPEVLSEVLGIPMNPVLVPEFPIKKRDSFQSTKVDYLALSNDGEQAFLVELKTDMASKCSPHGRKQEELLIGTAERGLGELLCDFIKLLKRHRASRARRKYIHLVYRLMELGMLVCGDKESLYTRAFEKSRGIYKTLETIEPAVGISGSKPKLKALYVQPKHCSTDRTCVVDFKTFARILKAGSRRDDTIRGQFADHLMKWRVAAGSPSPLTLHS